MDISLKGFAMFTLAGIGQVWVSSTPMRSGGSRTQDGCSPD
jgi:hypothetical protein